MMHSFSEQRASIFGFMVEPSAPTIKMLLPTLLTSTLPELSVCGRGAIPSISPSRPNFKGIEA